MTDTQKVLVERDLIKAIRTFHDCDDKEKREKYTREYFHEFCSKYDIDEKEALEMVEKYLEQKRESTEYKYEYFEDLNSIIYPDAKIPNTDDGDAR